MQGVICVNDVLLLGPTSLGEFFSVSIRGIHRKRLPVREVRGGQTASFALKKVNSSSAMFDLVRIASLLFQALCVVNQSGISQHI